MPISIMDHSLLISQIYIFYEVFALNHTSKIYMCNLHVEINLQTYPQQVLNL